MKKTIALSLVPLLVVLVSVSAVCPAQADIMTSPPPTWVKPAWKGITDPFLGTVSVAYVTGSKWTLNIWVKNNATNGTATPPAIPPLKEQMDARIYRVSVWFDWNKFYNTTFDVTMKYGDTRLFSVNGTTEPTSTASNLFTHNYRIYVEYEITYMKAGVGTIKQTKTWGPAIGTNTGSGFAVISQEQYDSALASENFWRLFNETSVYCFAYAESSILMVRAKTEAGVSATYYRRGEFSSALQHYNNASSLLNQAWTSFKSTRAAYETRTGASVLDHTLDRELAEIEAMRANTTDATTLAEAAATATMVNSVAFLLFGFGFTVFGIAAIVYARRHKPV